MGKKKQIINAYSCFMEEYGKKHRLSCKSKKDLAEAAAPAWAKLSKEQRQIYTEQANKLKHDSSKYTSQGARVDFILEEESQKKLRDQKMTDDIKDLIKVLSLSNNFSSEIFHIVSVNDFCFCNGTRRFIPAEFSVVKFNMQDGIIADNIFHYIVKPGALPLGYAGIATEVSAESHQLPVPLSVEEVEDNRHEITQALLKFMRIGLSGSGKKFPPLYCDKRYIEKAQNIIKYFLIDGNYDENLLQVYPLESLLYYLQNAVAGDCAWPSIVVSAVQLEEDIFDFCLGIACEFHENSDVQKFCSRSRVIRLAFILFANCCPYLDIPLIPGQHIPPKSLSVNVTTRQEDSLSSCIERKTTRPKSSFLSSRSESIASFKTDITNSYANEENNALSEDNFDLSQNTESGNWHLAKSRKKSQQKENSDPHTCVSGFSPTESLSFNSAGNSSKNVQQCRRPTVPSASLGKQFRQLSSSNDHRTPGADPSSSDFGAPISRGRGRVTNLWTKKKQND